MDSLRHPSISKFVVQNVPQDFFKTQEVDCEVLPGKIGTTDLTHTLTPLSTFYLRNMNRIELILTLWSPSLPYQLCISSRSANFSITCILENRPFGFQYQKLDTYIQDKLQFFCISKTKKKTKVGFIYTFLFSF